MASKKITSGLGKVNLTTARMQSLTCPDGRNRAHLYDAKIPGLCVQVTSTGNKAFYLYRWLQGRPERFRLGGWPQLSVHSARAIAEQRNADIGRGLNPQAVRRAARSEMTLLALFERYEQDHVAEHCKPSTAKNDHYLWQAYLKDWAQRKLSTITRQAVTTKHASIGKHRGKVSANRTVQLLNRLFNYAAKQLGDERINPSHHVKLFREHARERFLLPHELPQFFSELNADPNDDFRDLVLLLLFVGARRTNTQSMRWDDVDLHQGTWTIPDTKSGESVTLPLSESAMDILQRRHASANGNEYVFPADSKSGHMVEPRKNWNALCQRAGIENLKLHDLRRSLGSWQAGQGASLPLIGASLGHKGTRATSIYARLDLNPVRKSVEAATKAMIAASKQGN